MVLVEVGADSDQIKFDAKILSPKSNAPVVVLTTSETATSGVLAVLSNTTVTGRDMATVLASLREVGRHILQNQAIQYQ
jgi:hypothetical protein